jgi:hypothetical protein
MFEQKTATENTHKENQTDEAEFITMNRKQNKKQTVEIEPPEIHPTLKKIDEIRAKFSLAKLTADCGKSKINGKTEYEFFANARKKLTWFVQSWQRSIDYPLDIKSQDRFKSNVEMIEEIVEDADTPTKRLLISKAYRTVKSSFRHMFYKVEKLEANGKPNHQMPVQNNPISRNQHTFSHIVQQPRQQQQQQPPNMQYLPPPPQQQQPPPNMQYLPPPQQQQQHHNQTKNQLIGLLNKFLEGL